MEWEIEHVSESQGPNSPACTLIFVRASLEAPAPVPEGVRGIRRRGILRPLGPPFLTAGDRPHPAPPSGDSSSFPRQPNDSCLPECGSECRGQASHAAPAAEAQDPDEGLPQPGREQPPGVGCRIPLPHPHLRPQHLSQDTALPTPACHGSPPVQGLICD